jgi:hypothetical protein
MSSIIGYARARELCQELVASVDIPAPYDRERFTAALARHVHGKVRMAPAQLPAPCTALWLGCTGSDQVAYNRDWPEHEISLAGHAIGHLVLGHCGDVRDGGQFACTVAPLDAGERRQLSRQLHDPAKDQLSRLFSDAEEHTATVFSQVLAEQAGIGGRRHDIGDWTAPDALTCIG